MLALSGFNILVTRPRHQAENLVAALQRSGAHALRFPTLDIVSSTECQKLRTLADAIKDYDIALFVSQNAVVHAFEQLNAQHWPSTMQYGVVGKGSLTCLAQYGIIPSAIPKQAYNSEGLLNSSLLAQVSGKKIIIFRGQEGRNLLGDVLQERGAQVDYCEVYKRVMASIDEEQYKAVFKQPIHLAIFTSSEGLMHAFNMLKPKQAEQLRHIPWLLISERMKETAYNLGFQNDIIVADQASDEGILSALLAWSNKRH